MDAVAAPGYDLVLVSSDVPMPMNGWFTVANNSTILTSVGNEGPTLRIAPALWAFIANRRWCDTVSPYVH